MAGCTTQRGQQSPFHYGPAKAGLEQLTRHLAAELGPEKIRVNALVPGPFPQPGKMPPGLEERLAARTMLGRIGAPRGDRRARCCSWPARHRLL